VTPDQLIQQMRQQREAEEAQPITLPPPWHCTVCSQDLDWHKRTAGDVERTIGPSAAAAWEKGHGIDS